MKKRLLSVLLAAVLTVGLLPVTAMAQEANASKEAKIEAREQADLEQADMETIEEIKEKDIFSGGVSRDVGDNMKEETEPNNNIYAADVVEHDDTMQGTLDEEDIFDYYELTVTTRSTITIVMASDIEDIVCDIYDENDKCILAESEEIDLDEDGVYGDALAVVLDPGVYYVITYDLREVGCEDANYLFYVSVEPTDSYTYRLWGENRYETSIYISEMYREVQDVEEFDSVIVASGEGFADALAGSYLASVKEAPILMVKNKTSVIEGLAAYLSVTLAEDGTIYILGGEAAVSANIEKELASLGTGIQIKRLAGANRYATNLEILKEAGVADEDVMVCTGKDFADSLSASAINRPILLVNKTVSADQEAYLKTLSGNDYYIVGGVNAVSADVENVIKTYGDTERLGGANRFETSVLVAETFVAEPRAAVVAYAKNYPDGLCGGPLASALGAPLILTQNGREADATSYIQSNGIEFGIVLGGSGLISDNTARNIFGLSQSDPIIDIW